MNIAAAAPIATKPPVQPASLIVAFDDPQDPVRAPGMSDKELLDATRAAGLAVQAPAAKVLDAMKAKGLVDDYSQLWLVGIMRVQAPERNFDAIRDALLGTAGVQAIEVERTMQIQPELG